MGMAWQGRVVPVKRAAPLAAGAAAPAGAPLLPAARRGLFAHSVLVGCRHRRHVVNKAEAEPLSSVRTVPTTRQRTPEEKARHVRLEGWVAPGPPPVGNPTRDPDLTPRPGETLSYLAGDWRLFQLERGHRWSLDDHLTAVVALEAAAARRVESHLDLGCGIGSILLMVAHGLPHVRAVGVEAQDVSVSLARRSIRYNLGPSSQRVAVVRGDMRGTALPPELAPPGGKFDLVTGSPPYIPLDAGGRSGRPQKTPCNLEVRGGVEDYVAAAARVLAPGGAFVVVMGVQGQRQPDRVHAAAEAQGLRVTRHIEVVPREGKPPLMTVSVMEWAAAAGATEERRERFVVRLADGTLSADMLRARAAIGMPPPPPSQQQQLHSQTV